MSASPSVNPRQPPPRVIALDLFDPDALAEGVSGARLEHHQLGPGRFAGRIVRREVDGVQLDTGRYSRSLISLGSFQPGLVTVGCVLEGPESGVINGSRFGPGDFVVFPVGASMEYLVPAGTHWLALQCAPDLLADLGARDEGLSRAGVLAASSRNQAGCLGFLRQAASLDGGVAGPAGTPGSDRPSLPELLACLLGPQGDQRRRGSFVARERLVRRFRERVATDFGESRGVLDLCADLGVSPRTLQFVFREHLGVTPSAYCMSLRLTEVHRALLRGGRDDARIREAARRFGFTHMGRFAAAYRRQFGLLPSEALARIGHQGGGHRSLESRSTSRRPVLGEAGVR